MSVWVGLILAITLPFMLAANSPLLEWREPIYRIAGYAGVLALALMLLQPLLAAGYLSGIKLQTSRRLHRLVGVLLVVCVVLHIGALWITSPPDVVDALLFMSAVSFSIWGVIAMWAVFAAATLAAIRQRIPIRLWRLAHTLTVAIAVIGTVVHALLIEGTMETVSKVILCALVLLAVGKVLYDRGAWAILRRRRL